MPAPRSLRSVLVGLLASIAWWAVTINASAQPAQAPSLAGWWISIDEAGFKPLWTDGIIVPMEELLIVDSDGRFENRMMGFWSVDHEFCSTDRALCSDAPLLATGRMALVAAAAGSSATLAISDHRPTDIRIDTPVVDPHIRAAAISSSRVWSVSRFDAVEGMLVLNKATSHETRTFFRIEPDRLRRLRAAFKATELTASRHWRCFIAAATGAAVPAPGLRPAATLPPALADYLKAASYVQTAMANGMTPTTDDPDPGRRKLAALAVEELMNERFDTLPSPKTLQDRRRAMATAQYIGRVGMGEAADTATAALQRAVPEFEAPQTVSAREVAAFSMALVGTAEAKQLFCKP